MAQRTKQLARNHKTVLQSFSIEAAPPSNLRPPSDRAVSIFDLGMKWNDLRLVVLISGVVVAIYVLILAFGAIAPAGH
jgi:hypothetical protein